MKTLRSRRFPTLASTALAIVTIGALLIPSGVAAQTVIKGAAILDHPIGKLAVTNMVLLAAGKFEESLKLSNREYNERYASLPADRKAKMAVTMKQYAVADEKFRSNIQKLGVLTIDGDKATLTTKEVTDLGGGQTVSSGLEQRFTLENGQWKVAP
jgi:hypothetical protein